MKLIEPLLAPELMYALRGFHVPAAKCCFDWEVLVAVWCHVVRVCFDTRCVSFVEQSFSREQTSAFILAETETH